LEPAPNVRTKKLRETTHWYFKLDSHETWLREWIEKGSIDGAEHHEAKQWKKHVVGQCLSWLDGGLQPRSITRDLDWGIKVPLEKAEGKVLYVWFDIGKDNIVFHCIVFPSMLKAHGDYVLPTNVPSNQFLNFEGRKFSKSKNWGIEQHEYLEVFKEFPNKEDALRYALIRNMPENRDSDFKWDDFVDFHDNELVANLGNFINRVVVLTNKYYEGKVPASNSAGHALSNIPGIDDLIKEWQEELERFNFKNAIQKLMSISSAGNLYLQELPF